MNDKHTPTPWRIGTFRQTKRLIHIWAPGTPRIAEVILRDVSINEQKDNAAFIVNACNNYETLLTAAKKALEFMEQVESSEWDDGGAETIPDVEEFREALRDIEE